MANGESVGAISNPSHVVEVNVSDILTPGTNIDLCDHNQTDTCNHSCGTSG